MIKHAFPPEMFDERENQLILALLDCAGVYYDVNITQNRMLGRPIQITHGEEYDLLERINKPQNCTYTEIVEYWTEVMPTESRKSYVEFSDVENVKARYEAGERRLSLKFWTYDVAGNPMYAEQVMRLYKGTDGDLYALVYINNCTEVETFREKEHSLTEMYEQAHNQVSAMETLAASVPAGYHRCGTGEGFPLVFVSESFLDVVGWTREQLCDEIGNKYLEIVAPEDREFFLSHEAELLRNGRVDLAYRVRRRDGTRRWIQDATIMVEQNGTTYFQCTLSDITDYVEKLNAEKARAEESNLAKSTFLFNASHDIRTPMNAIQGFAHIIEKNYDNPQIVQDTVQKIIQSGNTLMTLLNDVLELSRIERGKDEVDELPMNMERHVEELHEMFASEMKQAEINFVMDNDIPHPFIIGDNLKLTRIAMNLLSNAKKFTPKGGTVTFGVKESGFNGVTANYSLIVRDTGIGMSKQFQQRAFQQFERERTSTESGVSGSGLGLAIIKRLADLMGGDCSIKSDLGKGTEITVTIPLTVVDEHAVHLTDSKETFDFTGKRILLVEDNELNREIARYILEDINIIVDEAEDGSECVDKLLKSPAGYYDLVLMDIQMPIMDGYTATREIRNIANRKIARIPIIAMTANAFIEDKQKCIEVGMNGHIGKPIDIAALEQELARIFK